MKRSLRSWLWSVPLNQEVDEEIAFHIEMRTRELVEKGMDPRVAREMVLARLGDVVGLKRTCVDLGRKREREMAPRAGRRHAAGDSAAFWWSQRSPQQCSCCAAPVSCCGH